MTRLRRITQDQVDAMLTEAAAEHGLTLEEFHELGRAGALTHWDLRDLWLIWGTP